MGKDTLDMVVNAAKASRPVEDGGESTVADTEFDIFVPALC